MDTMISFSLNKTVIVMLLLVFICVSEVDAVRQLQQKDGYSAENAFEAVQGLITKPSDQNASEILLDYVEQGRIEEFVEGSGQVLEQGGVVGLIAVRRLAAGIQQASVQQANIASLLVSTVAASEQKYADAYVQVFEAMFRDQGCEAFGKLSDATKTYFQDSKSDQLGSCLEKNPSSPQKGPNANETAVETPQVPKANETSVESPQVAKNVLQNVDSPPVETVLEPTEITQESANLAQESDEVPQVEAIDETQQVPKTTPQEKELEENQIAEATVTNQGVADESMVSIISAVHHSNEAAANMILTFLEQGKLSSVVASFAEAVKNGHTEAALEALGDAIEQGLQCQSIQNLLSQIAVNLSSIAVDQLAQHSRTIPQIQNCLGKNLDACTPSQSASCCASSGPTDNCQLVYAEENSVPSLGISVFRSSVGTQLCQCPASV